MDRGRMAEANRQARVGDDRLIALTHAVGEWNLAQDKIKPIRERTVLGLVRMAAKSGCTVSEIAGVTCQPKTWVRARLVETPAHRGR